MENYSMCNECDDDRCTLFTVLPIKLHHLTVQTTYFQMLLILADYNISVIMAFLNSSFQIRSHANMYTFFQT